MYLWRVESPQQAVARGVLLTASAKRVNPHAAPPIRRGQRSPTLLMLEHRHGEPLAENLLESRLGDVRTLALHAEVHQLANVERLRVARLVVRKHRRGCIVSHLHDAGGIEFLRPVGERSVGLCLQNLADRNQRIRLRLHRQQVEEALTCQEVLRVAESIAQSLATRELQRRGRVELHLALDEMDATIGNQMFHCLSRLYIFHSVGALAREPQIGAKIIII